MNDSVFKKSENKLNSLEKEYKLFVNWSLATKIPPQGIPTNQQNRQGKATSITITTTYHQKTETRINPIRQSNK